MSLNPKTIGLASLLVAVVGVGSFIGIYYMPGDNNEEQENVVDPHKVTQDLTKLHNQKAYGQMWEYLHPSEKDRWGSKEEYREKIARIVDVTQAHQQYGDIQNIATTTYTHPIRKNGYDNVWEAEVSVEGGEATTTTAFHLKEVDGELYYFSNSLAHSDSEWIHDQELATIPYPQLEKEPEKYTDTFVQYTGQVTEIQEQNGVGQMRLAVSEDEYGYWDDNIYVVYTEPTEVVKDDIITVSGRLTGSYTYQSTAGWTITIPSLLAYDIQQGRNSSDSEKQSENTSASNDSTGNSTPQPSESSTPQLEQQTTPSYSKIPGLTAIRASDGLWENWDADAEEDGPTIDIVYLDSSGDIISHDATKHMEISAEVKLYAAQDALADANKLVYSGSFSTDEIVYGDIYPVIRIPKEEIDVDTSDYKYGKAEVNITTPSQGSFGDTTSSITLYQ